MNAPSLLHRLPAPLADEDIALLDEIAVPLSGQAVLSLLRKEPRAPVLIMVKPAVPLIGPLLALLAVHPSLARRLRFTSGGEGRAACRGWYIAGLEEEEIRAAAVSEDPVAHLCRSSRGGEQAVYRLAARARRLDFLPDLSGLDPALPRLPPPRAIPLMRAARFQKNALSVTVLAPRPHELGPVLDGLDSLDPATIRITTPTALFRRLHDVIAETALTEAVRELAEGDPPLSARGRPTLRERGLILLALFVVILGAVLAPAAVATGLVLLSTCCFLALGMLRSLVLMDRPRPVSEPPPLPTSALPSYTLLVPLLREAHMLPGLFSALDRLDYPLNRLQILILVEADDGPTRTAAAAECASRPHAALLVVPTGAPRTKPRALAYGLAFARGDIVSVYDAEDRPDPLQLRKAAEAFAAGRSSLACLQARLKVDRSGNWLQRQFSIEYEVLFEALLPWLGRHALPVPLGGTSNHFKRSALEHVFAWDPWNVTEDADLGIRLMRFGFTTAMLESVTFEEAPGKLRIWHHQRVRWIKGWMLTWLVHSRQPFTLKREIGGRAFLMFQAHALATIGAAFAHPLGVGFTAFYASGLVPGPFGTGFLADCLFAASLLVMMFGYGATFLLARRVLKKNGRRDLLKAVWGMPFYWLFAFFAASAALKHLILRPSYWAKTPHVGPDKDAA